MSETVTERGMKGADEAPELDPHEAEARERWKIYTVVFGALFVLTILELYVGDLIADKNGQIATLIALMMAKATLVVLYYMHLRWESRVLRWLVIVPFFAAIFFVVILLWV
ncbi:MAG: cytochrome C oxidase subunit IV family protein [Thermoplasmata archaeon]|nr:MAG: cytochrome C oxidase subunit IV family protein [Thermoplasmata archaeon]